MSLRRKVLTARRRQPKPENRVLSSEEGVMLPTAPLSMAAASNSPDDLLARTREVRAEDDAEIFANAKVAYEKFKKVEPKEQERNLAELRKRRSKQECETESTAWTILAEYRFIMLVHRFMPLGDRALANKYSIVDHMHNIYNDEAEMSSSFIEGKDIDSYMEALSAYGAGDTTVKRFEPRYAVRPTFEEIDKKLANMIELKVHRAIVMHRLEEALSNDKGSSSNGYESSSNSNGSSSNGYGSSSGNHPGCSSSS